MVTKAITVRVTEKELRILKDIAKKTGQSLSATVRNVIHYDIIKYAQKNIALKVLTNDADIGKKKGGSNASQGLANVEIQRT